MRRRKTRPSSHQVALIRGSLQLLVDPALGLVTVALKQLELVGELQLLATARRLLIQQVAAVKELVTALSNVI